MTFIEYENISRSVGLVVSTRLATLHELDTVLGIEDLYVLTEIAMIDAHNRRIASQAQE